MKRKFEQIAEITDITGNVAGDKLARVKRLKAE